MVKKGKAYWEAIWEARKEKAIELVKAWAEATLRNHEEPVRAGKRRGELIGFTKTKRKAALFMALYPLLDLNETADMVGVSGNLLRKWRTEEQFLKISEKDCIRLGRQISDTIQFAVEAKDDPKFKCFYGEGRLQISSNGVKDEPDFVFTYLFLLHPLVIQPFMDFMLKRLKSGVAKYIPFFLSPFFVLSYDKKELKKRLRSPQILDLKKKLIRVCITALADPQSRKGLGQKAIKNIAEGLEFLVLNTIDELAR